jgi:hypothetical protein
LGNGQPKQRDIDTLTSANLKAGSNGRKNRLRHKELSVT